MSGMLSMLHAALSPFLASTLTLVCFVSPCAALDLNWKEIFPIRKHDFGIVAVAAKTEFSFPIENTSDRPIHIRTVRASCGCTTPTVDSNTIAPGQTSYLHARFNTDTFKGKRGANLTVVIDRPIYTEVRLRVDGFIRSDLVFHPGAVEFKRTSSGSPVTQTVKVFYAGRKNWHINKIESPQSWLVADIKELSRRRGRINYEVTVTIDNAAPTGFFQDELVLFTDDSGMPRVPLRVTGEITAPLTISPGIISLGTVRAGTPTSKKIVVLGQRPFVIESLTAEGWKVDVSLSSEAKKTHILRPSFDIAGTSKGAFKSTLIITTAGENSSRATALVTADVASD